MDYKNGIRVIPAKMNQLMNFVEKVWGHEEWIVNNKKYCGKKLFVKKGFCCSIHHHKIKEETFYIVSGKIFLETEFDGKKRERVLTAGDIEHIKIGMWHRFIGLQDSEIIEFSTFHMDSDSYRREIGGQISLKKINFSQIDL